MKTFTFSVTGDTKLTVDQIWPDGDAPTDPTADDVLDQLVACGTATGVIEDWNLDCEFVVVCVR